MPDEIPPIDYRQFLTDTIAGWEECRDFLRDLADGYDEDITDAKSWLNSICPIDIDQGDTARLKRSDARKKAWRSTRARETNEASQQTAKAPVATQARQADKAPRKQKPRQVT